MEDLHHLPLITPYDPQVPCAPDVPIANKVTQELSQITDEAIYEQLQMGDMSMGRWTAEDPSLRATGVLSLPWDMNGPNPRIAVAHEAVPTSRNKERPNWNIAARQRGQRVL